MGGQGHRLVADCAAVLLGSKARSKAQDQIRRLASEWTRFLTTVHTRYTTRLEEIVKARARSVGSRAGGTPRP